MLPSIFRLKKKNDFDRVFDLGKAKSGEFFALKIAHNELLVTRFGFIISAKTAPKAVSRNRLRRQANEIIRLNLDRIKPGFDVAVIFKRVAQGKKYLFLEKDLCSLLSKSGLFLKNSK